MNERKEICAPTHESSSVRLAVIEERLSGAEQFARIPVLEERTKALEQLVEERDRLYKERDDARKTAVDAALAAQKEQTKSSFEASKEAIGKSEQSQTIYNAGHNDLSRKMEVQYSTMVPQTEARLKWDSVDKAIEGLRKDNGDTKISHQVEIANLRTELMREIQGLRESRAAVDSEKQVRGSDKQSNQWMVMLALGVTTFVVGSGLTIATIIAMRFGK
jgi:hypothetical protein